MAARSPGASSWATFAGVFLGVVGLFNIMDGIVALAREEYFNEAGLVFQNLQAWAWAYVVVGIIQLIAGWLVLSANAVGRWMGVAIAVISMLVSFFAIGAYPLWAITTMVIDGVVIWGLTARWEE